MRKTLICTFHCSPSHPTITKKKTPMQIKELINPNFVVFCKELEEAVQEGYFIDMNNCPEAGPTYFAANMIKYETEEAPKKAGRPFKKVG